MRVDYATVEALQARARHERALAVYRLLVAPVLRLFAPRPRKVDALEHLLRLR